MIFKVYGEFDEDGEPIDEPCIIEAKNARELFADPDDWPDQDWMAEDECGNRYWLGCRDRAILQ